MRTFLRHALLTIGRALVEFFTWWTRELFSFVPPRWRPGEGARLEIRKDDLGFQLTIVASSTLTGEARLESGVIDPADSVVCATTRERKLPVWLIMPKGYVLRRRVQIPIAATTRFETLLCLEMDRWSPYQLDEVYATWEEQTSKHETRREIELRIVPRAHVTDLCSELGASGLHPQIIVLDELPTHRIDLRPRSANLFTAKAGLAYLSIALTLVALAADWIAAKTELNVWRARYHDELHAFSLQRELEDKITKTVTSIERAKNSPSLGKGMASLVGVLPPTDWLTNIQITGGTYVLQGYAENMDRLLKALEPIAADRKISLQGEVAYDSGKDRQHFSVTFNPRGT